MSKQLFALALAFLLCLAPHLDAAPKVKRHSVLDFYYLLPFVGNTPNDKTQRQKLLDEPGAIVDVRRDFIKVDTDSFPPQQIAVFRYKGAEVVAVSAPDYHSDYNLFHLYRLRDGKLRDVTAKELPVPARTGSYLYELPRYGTTIRVYQFDLNKQTRQHAFDLQWRGGRFVVSNRLAPPK